METYGLIGKDISYSFSKSYFTQKFASEAIKATYQNFDIQNIEEFLQIQRIENLRGLNVTIPYKEEIIPYLHDLNPHAQKIGAVNTIKFENSGELIGFNTDFIGFTKSIKPRLQSHHTKALILGTGGASKAVAYALSQLKIDFAFVSRTRIKNGFTYQEVNKKILQEYKIIVNCTPLGTFPKTEQFPPIPIQFLNSEHLVFDLIYNPETTNLLRLAQEKGARICNGLEMLQIQAQEAWSIWNS